MSKDIKTLTYIYSVRVYTAVITILLIPFLIGEIGIEAYGLIGFFTILQACLSILDAGVGGVLTRESIIAKKSLISFEKFNVLYKKVIIIFGSLSLLIIIVGWLVCQRFSMTWLNTSLSDESVITSTTLMFWIFALKYMQGPFRSIILSNESQITLTTINLINVTLSQPIALLLLKFFKGDVVLYFEIQLAVALLNSGFVIICGEKIRKRILIQCKKNAAKDEFVPNSSSVKTLFFFALQLSTLSILWVIVNQSDKLALTKYIPLSQYGVYSVAVSVISVLSILSDPLNQYLQPRLTNFYLEKKNDCYTKTFLNAFIFIGILTIPLSAFLIFYSQQIIFIWSNNLSLSIEVEKYLPALFLGGVFAIYSNFVFLLLYSFGDLKKHAIIYTIFSFVVIPANIYIAKNYLGEGTSVFSAASAIALFILWGGYNFKHTFSGGLKIIYIYLLPLFLIEIVYFKFSEMIMIETNNRLVLFIVLLLFGFIGVIIALIYHRIINKFIPTESYRLVKK